MIKNLFTPFRKNISSPYLMARFFHSVIVPETSFASLSPRSDGSPPSAAMGGGGGSLGLVTAGLRENRKGYNRKCGFLQIHSY